MMTIFMIDPFLPPSPLAFALHARQLAKIKAQGGPVAQGRAIRAAEAEQAAAAEKIRLERAFDDAIARGDVAAAFAAFAMFGRERMLTGSR